MNGVVHATGGGLYRVRTTDGSEVEAALRGRLKLERRTGEKVVIGDRVRLTHAAGTWVIDAVEERTSEMVRRGPGGRTAKVVAANLDRVLVVVAARDPQPSAGMVDRLLAVVEASGLPPVLVVNKTDLPGADERVEELRRTYEPVGYRVLAVSARTGAGMEAFSAVTCDGISALVGPSGAGKSSLLNALHPELSLATGALSVRTGRGRHTTVSSRLVPLGCGGKVADTPGFGDVGLWGIAPGEVERCFPEISALAEECRFHGCAHASEPDCAVRDAVERGDVARSRYESYLVLREESRAR